MYDVMGTTRIRTCPWTWGLKMEGSVEVQSRRYVARSKRSMRGGVVPSGRTRNAESCRCAHMAKWIHLPSAARDRCGCARAGQDALGTLGISLRERSNALFSLRRSFHANACVICGPRGRQSLRVGWAFPPNLWHSRPCLGQEEARQKWTYRAKPSCCLWNASLSACIIQM